MSGLPLPPSANALYVQRTGRRILSLPYKAWRGGAAIVARASMKPLPKKMPLSVLIEASASRRRDIDNLVKPTLDMLQVAGVIRDDRMVDDCRVVRTPGSTGDMAITVEVLA